MRTLPPFGSPSQGVSRRLSTRPVAVDAHPMNCDIGGRPSQTKTAGNNNGTASLSEYEWNTLLTSELNPNSCSVFAAKIQFPQDERRLGVRRNIVASASGDTPLATTRTFQAPVANSHEETFGDPDALARAIQALPPGQRQAVELLKLRELSLKEASALTGMSIGALKIATHRAIASLRRTLRGIDEG